MSQKHKSVAYLLRLYPGRDDELIHWLGRFGKSYGVKSNAIKEALRRGIGSAGVEELSVTTAAVDMAEIRRVVEAAVAQAVTSFGGQIGGGAVPDRDEAEEEEVEAMLDRLGATLVFTLDEEGD
jgi:hypothetical protein